jgi:type IV pilus assembly protein PilE
MQAIALSFERIEPMLRPSTFNRARGFTLIEVMIVVAIVGILAAVAIPSYREYNQRSTITEATMALGDHRNKMEQFFLDNRSYQNAGNCGIAASTALRFYTLTCTAGSATTYTVTATGRTGTAALGFTYTIDQDNIQRTTALPANWTGTTLPVNRWVVRRGG